MIVFVILVHWVRLLTLRQRWLHSFTQWMKPNAVTVEPCGLMVLQPLSEHNVMTIALSLSEHNIVTICSFGLWATKAAHFWRQRKENICGCCSFKTIFFSWQSIIQILYKIKWRGFQLFFRSTLEACGLYSTQMYFTKDFAWCIIQICK